MRRNFAQVLKAGKIDIKNEYSKFYDLFYGKNSKDGKSVADIISDNFFDVHFRGTCLSLDEFNAMYGFYFVKQPTQFDIDYLVSFCEYIYNFISGLHEWFFFGSFDKTTYLSQIYRVVEAIGYITSHEDGFVIFVPKDNVAVAVSEMEIIPEEVSYKVISYNHHSMKGNLEGKRGTLVRLAYLLEPKDDILENLDKTFKKDLFYLFNNLGLRHNNLDPDGKKYKEFVAQMLPEELEHWYDETYRMCLLAFLRLEHIDRKRDFDALKAKIEGTK